MFPCRSMSQIKDEVVGLMTRLETAAELDADSVSRQQPAVHKLMMLKDIQNVSPTCQDGRIASSTEAGVKSSL